LESALRQLHKMGAVGQLTAELAHDFNNSLAGVFANLDLMQARVAQGRTEELARYIEEAIASATRASGLTRRLLALSRGQTFSPKPTNVSRLVGGMMDFFRGTVGPAIQIEIEIPIEPWPTLCDANVLESALLNLVINARDSMLDGGHLLIEIANTVVDRSHEASSTMALGDYVALSVTDTGTGMPPNVAARAFDPFFTTKPIDKGTGLGLSMIYGFVRSLGGVVRLHTGEGQGTRVTILLPRYFGAAEAAAL
jgi:signal transduction histidine kinase